MLTQKSTGSPAPTTHHKPKAAALDELICYFEGAYVPMGEAKVSVMTHAFMYGTATFEGIRAYWNEEHGRLYGLKLREHVERIRQSCRILLMENVPSVDELTGLIIETVRRNGFREDAYIRPSFYKSTRAIGVRLHDLENELYIIALPFGNYIDTESGVRIMTSSWRRNADEALPARGKIVGGYVNMAFQKTEAELNGFDEALVLTAGGHVNEASAANLFVVRDGVAITPAGQRRPPRGRHPQGDPGDPRERGHPDRDPLDRPLRAVRRRRGAAVRDGRPGVAGHRGRPSPRRVGPDRPDRPTGARALLRRGPRPAARVQPLADAHRIGERPASAAAPVGAAPGRSCRRPLRTAAGPSAPGCSGRSSG